MDKKDSPPFEIIIGVGLVIVAVAAFLVASLARTAGSVAPTLTPIPPTPLPVTAPTARPTATAALGLSSPIPVTETLLPAVAVPEIAPDFSLLLAGGGAFTLTEQLARGPVVLAFFQMVG